MTELRLLTSRDCHLCDHAKALLDELRADGVLTWREVTADGDEGVALAATAPPLRPVLFDAGGGVLGYGRLSGRRLRRRLAPAAAEGGR